MSGLGLAARFAARELRSGVRGFRIFLACLALGVAAIAATGSTAEAFRQGLAAQARDILGGDLAVTARERRFTPAERAAFSGIGQTAYAAGAEAMARSDAGVRRLVELRGVDDRYPVAGQVTVEGAPSLQAALADRPGHPPGAAAEPALLDRLGLRPGDALTIGESRFELRAVLKSEPDRVGRLGLGPRVIARLDAVERTGLLEPGGLFSETARIATPGGADPARIAAALRRRPDAHGLDIRDRSDAAPGARRLIDRVEAFLGLIGLAALLAGGLGVRGAVSAHLESRKASIATLKALGADGPLLRDAYLLQIAALAMVGIGLGVAAGAAAPFLIGAAVGDRLPLPALFAIYPLPLARAALFGALAAAAFALEPLGRARAASPASLFRKEPGGQARSVPETLGAGLAGAGLCALAFAGAPSPFVAAAMLAAVAAAFAVLILLGAGAAALAGRLRAHAPGPVRLGLANLAGPRSAARAAAPAIGLGIALMSAVALIQSSLLAEVRQTAPRSAPSDIYTEIPFERTAEFDKAAAAAAGPLGPDRYLRLPFATGRISAVRGAPVDRRTLPDDRRWAFDNDISVSVIDAEPQGAAVTAGRWWPAGYAGPPLVALDERLARAGGLRPGDTVTLNLLGRDLDARVAALRRVDFGAFGPDVEVVVDPAALTGAQLRSVALARFDPAGEARFERSLAARFPMVNAISVRAQLDAAAELFDRLSLAIRGAAAVAALAGLLVLAGAIAAGAPARAREAATLKALGASSGQILLAYVVEYGAVGVIAGICGAAIGAAAAWPAVTFALGSTFAPAGADLPALVAGAAAITALGGLLAARAALARPPARALRSE